MLEKIDVKLIHIMIDVEVQAGTPNHEIIQIVQKKYPGLTPDSIGFHILKRKREWIKKLLESYHYLSSWGYPEIDWSEDWGEESVYTVYKDIPEGYILKMMIDDALIEYGKKDHKLRAVLVMYYIDSIPATYQDIMKIFKVSKKTVYNWLNRATKELVSIIENNRKFQNIA